MEKKRISSLLFFLCLSFPPMKIRQSIILLIISFFCVQVHGTTHAKTNEPTWYSDYNITFYKIDLAVNDTTTHIAGNVTIVSTVNVARLDTFKFELSAVMKIDSVVIDKKKVVIKRSGDLVSGVLASSKKQGQLMTAVIYYNGEVTSSGFFSPLASQRDNFWKISITWTLSEPLGAKNWFPCKQQLADKADSAWIFITVPKHCKAGSNGLLTRIVPVDNQSVRYEWKTRYPIAYYLLSFAVADYADYSFYARINDNDSIFVQNYIYNRPNYLSSYKSWIDNTKDYLSFYAKTFGAYPFRYEKYGHCVAPIGGGMEHQTMTTLSSFDKSLVSHELAHQWFGDMVTCSSWQDIWVNEGFASYAEYLVIDNLESHESAKNWMISAHQTALQEKSGSVYIPLEDSENDTRIFSYSLTYKKGASIIHSLRYELNNDSLFFNILRQYLRTYKDSVASATDFINVVNKLSGKDFKWFFDQWYYGSGYPVFDISWKQTGNQLTLFSSQKTSDASTPFFRTHFDVKLVYASGDTTITLSQEKPLETFLLNSPKEVVKILFDPEEWLLKVSQITKTQALQLFDNYLEIVPNPFSNELVLNFKNMPESDRLVTLTDIAGETKFQYNVKKSNEVRLTTNSLPPATYVLCVIEGNKKSTRKVVKVR